VWQQDHSCRAAPLRSADSPVAREHSDSLTLWPRPPLPPWRRASQGGEACINGPIRNSILLSVYHRITLPHSDATTPAAPLYARPCFLWHAAEREALKSQEPACTGRHRRSRKRLTGERDLEDHHKHARRHRHHDGNQEKFACQLRLLGHRKRVKQGAGHGSRDHASQSRGEVALVDPEPLG